MNDDPLDVRRVLSDTVELLCHEMIVDSENRIERSNQLNYFLDRLGGNFSHGRLYSFSTLASVCFEICARDPYPVVDSSRSGSRGRGGSRRGRSMATETDNEDEEDGGEESEPTQQYRSDFTPLSEFTAEKWERAVTDLRNVRNVLLRRDATRDVLPKKINDFTPLHEVEESEEAEEEEEEDGGGELNEVLAANALFADNYKDVVNAFRFQQSFSFIRKALEEEVVRAEEDRRDTLHIETHDLKAYEEFISEHFEEGHGIRECLESILVKGESEKSRTRSAGLALKPAAEVRDIIRGKNFDLVRFQRKIEIIIQKWYDAVLPRPVLAELGYGRVTLPPLPERDPGTGEAMENEEITAGEDEEVSEDLGQSPSQSPRRSRMDSESESPDSSRVMAVDGVSRGEKRREEEIETSDSDSLAPAPAPAKKKQRVRSSQKIPTPSKVPEVKALRERRNRLLEEGIEDPLKECSARAEEAAKKVALGRQSADAVETEDDDDEGSGQPQPPSPLMQRRKKTKHKVGFSDSDDSDSDLDERDDDSNEGQTAALSEVPERAKVHRLSGKGRNASTRSATQAQGRRRFTEQEDAAIKIGVEKFGFGRWAVIKNRYTEELRSRSSVQIKDRYRTLAKNNLL